MAASADPRRGLDPPPRLTVLGVPVDAVDAPRARRFLAAALADPWDGRCRHVVTLNPEYVIVARRDRPFATAIAAADLIVADGVGVALAARWLDGARARGPDRVTGGDLCEWLAALSGATAAPLFLLGGAPGVGARAAATLVRRSPGVRIAGAWDGGSPRPADDAESLARIAATGARAVLVAYGAPGQVLWIERHRTSLAAAGVRLAIGIGGAMDYLAGTVPRAPARLRALGLEWLYRLLRQPWRWRRQLVLPHFALLTGLAWLWRRGNRARRWVRMMTPGSPAPPPVGQNAASDRGAEATPEPAAAPPAPQPGVRPTTPTDAAATHR